MAKRNKKKSGNSPNIPQEVLDRVRQENADDDGLVEDAEEARKKAERRAERAARRAARQQRQAGSTPSDKPKKRNELGATAVAEMLANPTSHVDQEELKVQYSYVITDLRNMGILAGILLVVLIALGFLV